MTLDTAPAASTLTLTSAGEATVVSMSCADPPAGVECEFAPSQVSVPAGGASTTELRFGMAFGAIPGTHVIEVVGVGTGGVRETARVELTVTETCSGFTEQASYTGVCDPQAGIVCYTIGGSSLLFVLPAGEQPVPGPWNPYACGSYRVGVMPTNAAEYHHPLGTNFMKRIAHGSRRMNQGPAPPRSR
jgi:hypothetical protein